MNNKIKIFIIIFFTFIVNAFLYGQIKKGTVSQLMAFTKTTTVFVENEMYPKYNEAIKEYVPKFWKITPYKFISRAELDKYIINKQYSFVIISEVTIKNSKGTQNYIYLNTLLGGKPKLNNLTDIGSFPIADSEDDEDVFVPKIGALIKMLQYHLKTSIEHPDMEYDKLLKYYNKNSKKIKDMELLITKDNLNADIEDINKIKQIYPYKVRIVSNNEIKKAIDNEESNTVFFHNVFPKKIDNGNQYWKMVISVSDGTIYYIVNEKYSVNSPEKLTSKDLKKFK